MRKIVIVAFASAVLLAACSGSGGGASSKSGSGDHSSSGGSNDFSSLVAKTKSAKYKVTYSNGNDTPFTISQDPPLFSYISGTSQTYVTADGSAVECNGGPETSPPTSSEPPTCTAVPGGGAAIQTGLTSAFGAIGALLVSDAGKGIPGLTSITKTSSATIAGRDAECATIDASSLGVLGSVSGAKGSYTVCADKDTGVMLESKSDDGSGNVTDVKATSFGTPSEADVTPPVTPVTIPQ
jgi:hypothetical protein